MGTCHNSFHALHAIHICDALDTNYIFSFIFFYPFHYLILYICWAIKDKNINNEISISRKYHIIQYVNYMIFANFMVIMCSSCLTPLCLVSCTTGFLVRFIGFILVLLALYYAIYYSCYYIIHNIKIFIITSTIILLFLFLLICIFVYKIESVNIILSRIISIIYKLVIFIGIVSSLYAYKEDKVNG